MQIPTVGQQVDLPSRFQLTPNVVETATVRFVDEIDRYVRVLVGGYTQTISFEELDTAAAPTTDLDTSVFAVAQLNDLCHYGIQHAETGQWVARWDGTPARWMSRSEAAADAARFTTGTRPQHCLDVLAVTVKAEQQLDGDDPCPFTQAHTSDWCGHAGCRES